MLYELRHYDAHSSRSLDQLSARFSNDTLRIWPRYDIEPVGFWSVMVGPSSPRLTYLLAWPDLGQRQTRWDAFASDPEWLAAKAESESETGSLTHTITSSILLPTGFSPIPRHDNQPSRLAGGIFELRTYSFDDGAKLSQVSQWFGTQGKAHLDKHGMYVMGFWTTYLGVSPRLTYMLVFENLAHRERAWAAFYTDPQWPRIQDGLYAEGHGLIAGIESCLMKGTQFSGWR